jgi:hypothetical protein
MAFGLLTGTSGINPDFLSRLEALRRALPNNLGAQIGIKSGYRSPAHQAELYARAVQKYGSPQAARKWVAPPGHSQHNRGFAVDLSYGSPEAERAAHQLAAQYGLTFPMSYENWHIEPIGARGGAGANTAQAAPAAAVSAAIPENSVAGLLSKASFGGESSAPGVRSGGADIGGLVSGGGTPPDTNLQTFSADPPDPPGTPIDTSPDLSPLAGLFSLPAIGTAGATPPDMLPSELPGQAKQLKPKVWL